MDRLPVFTAKPLPTVNSNRLVSCTFKHPPQTSKDVTLSMRTSTCFYLENKRTIQGWNPEKLLAYEKNEDCVQQLVDYFFRHVVPKGSIYVFSGYNKKQFGNEKYAPDELVTCYGVSDNGNSYPAFTNVKVIIDNKAMAEQLTGNSLPVDGFKYAQVLFRHDPLREFVFVFFHSITRGRLLRYRRNVMEIHEYPMTTEPKATFSLLWSLVNATAEEVYYPHQHLLSAGLTRQPLEYLGSGHFSVVYKSVEDHGEAFVVKVLKTPGQAAVKQEVDCLAAIAKIGQVRIAPELVNLEISDGYGFASKPVGKHGKLTLPMILELADDLKLVHDNGIVNRDIRPSNLVVAGDHALICDWGSATKLGKETLYEGTVSTASNNVLQYLLYLKGGNNDGPLGYTSTAADDISSLTRTILLIIYPNQKTSLPNTETADREAAIIQFWKRFPDQFRDDIKAILTKFLNADNWESFKACAKELPVFGELGFESGPW